MLYFPPGELNLVAVGPLTNVAMAIRLDPEFGKRLKKCFIMGGNYHGMLVIIFLLNLVPYYPMSPLVLRLSSEYYAT